MTTETSTANPSTTLLDGVDPAKLYEPFELSGVQLSNRFVLPPMTRKFSPSGVPGDNVADYYRRRATHFGLLITEGTYIDHPSSGSHPDVPRFYGEDALEGWRRVVDAVHAEGGKIFPQLWHLGVAREAGSEPNPSAPVLSPSGLTHTGAPVGTAATLGDIDAIIASFARAAADAKRVGFDGIELHGAHGYLLDQFFWSATNRRLDGYGGSLKARTRLSQEVVAAVRDAVGPDFPVVFRYSQWKGTDYTATLADTGAELEELLDPLVAAGIDAFHVSTRRYWLPAFEGDSRTLSGWTKAITGLPTITLGSVGVAAPFLGGENADTLSLAPLLELYERGEFDLIAVGRAALSEPAWPSKVREGNLDDIRFYEKGHESKLY